MKPPPRSRLALVHAALVLFAFLLVGKSAQVQLVQGEQWARSAERQQFASASLPAPRGMILDANGEVLAESREVLHLSVAPREVRDLAALRRALERLDVAPRFVSRAVDRKHAWVELPGYFLPVDAAPLLAVRGVHARPALHREGPATEGTRRIVGRTDRDGVAVDGVELALDSLLRGQLGRTRLLRDARGRSFESPAGAAEEPMPGNTVVLTLNHQLQDIAEHAIARAMQETGASGGDIVVLDPRGGEILALASRRKGTAVSGVPAFTDSYEPGSTIKPFLAARMLAMGKTHANEVIATYNGSYAVAGRRTPIRDVHRAPAMTVADIIRHSSNVGIVRLVERLTPGEQFEALRDFGFGQPTGVLYPSEASGRLPLPVRWSRTTASALAMGYEVGVTPLQLANAYAALANGGELLEPALIREIRSPNGDVLYRHQRRVIRRVVPEDVATQMRDMLASVVDSGTARGATLTTYAVGGKSGTARLSVGRGYEGGAYTASFVALFPAEQPQLVVLVKLDRPQGAYYGGKTAAPASKAVLVAALAARDAALDPRELSRAERPTPRPAPVSLAAREQSAMTPVLPEQDVAPRLERPANSAADEPPARAVFALASRPDADAPSLPPPRPERAVPDVSGLPLRDAVRRLHEAGFRVRVTPSGAGTAPAAGSVAPAGSVVKLAAGARR